MQYLSALTATDRYNNRSTKYTDNISDKSNMFDIPSIRAHVAVMYLLAKSCLHIVIIFYGLLNMMKICQICLLITCQCRIPRKCEEMAKFRGSAENSRFHGKLWSLCLCVISCDSHMFYGQTASNMSDTCLNSDRFVSLMYAVAACRHVVGVGVTGAAVCDRWMDRIS